MFRYVVTFKRYKFWFPALLLIVLLCFGAGSALAAVGTNLGDFAPSSVVTVSGDNSGGAGWAAGETVHVVATAPDGSSISGDATADDAGSWSCGLTLASDAPTGTYSYTATGLTSNISQSGTFTVSAPATSAPGTPWIQSDQADYAPASTVTLTSGGWQPGETVSVLVNDSIGHTWQITQSVTADSTGAFTYQFALPDTFVATYSVTATGTALDVATTSFTDAIGSIFPTSGPEGVGFTLTVNRSGGANYTASTRIVFAGTTLTTTLVNTSQVTATVPASLVPEEGTKTVATTSPTGGPLNFTVTEGDVFTLTPQAVTATTSTAFSGTVATLADTYDNTAIGTFTATINWGDNTGTSAGTVTRTGVGTYSIAGSHTYAGQSWSTSVKTATAFPASTIPVANNGTTNFASSGSLVVFTGSGYQTVTYTGKTGGTSASFTGVSGWTGSGSLAANNSITQPFSAVSVTVTESSPGSATASTTSPLTVGDGIAYNPSAGNLSAAEGATYGGSQFATFPGTVFTNVFASPGNYKMKITAGSSSSWWSVASNGVNNFFTVSGSADTLTLGDEGSQPYTETLYRNDGTVACSASGTITINDAGPLSYISAVNPYNSAEGASTGSIQIGKFLDPYAGDHSADFTATVHWGDGSSDTVPVVYAGLNGSQSTYTISGSHTYGEEGNYAATYDVSDDGGSHLTGISTATVAVSDPAVAVTGVDALTTTFGTPLGEQTLATFTDPGGAEANDGTHYSATINWGGSFGTGAGTITFSAGTFTVKGTVPYTAYGTYSPTVTVTHEATAPQPVTDQVSIDQAPLTITAKNASKTYGDLVTFAGTEFTATGLASGDGVASVTLTSAGAAAAASVAGSPYDIVPSDAVAAAGTDLGNYKITYIDGKLTVKKAELTVTADNKTKLLNAPNPPLTYTITGFVNAESDAVVSGSPALSTTATTTSPVGKYPITCTLGTLAADNYSFTFVNGTLWVQYGFSGFLQPINDTAHQQPGVPPMPLSIFKGGSTIPVKFQLTDANGVVVQTGTAPIWVTPAKNGNAKAAIDESVPADSPMSGSTYSWDGLQYHYNWSTKGVPIGFYWKIGVMLDDGTSYYVNIGLK